MADIEEIFSCRGRNVSRKSDSYMIGVLLTGTGKGFLTLNDGGSTTGGEVGFWTGMTSEENLIFLFLRRTSALA